MKNNIKLISFVGVDTQTNMDDIVKIKNDITCEFSVLFSDSKSLGNYTRYPSYKFCKEFLEWGSQNNIITSLHLCGSVIERYLKKEKDVIDLCNIADRIQLNLNIKDYTNHLELTERLWSVLKHYGHSIILQQNKTKEKFIKTFLTNNIFPISLLHDGSGGFGREITQVTPPDEKYFTGYAGGIKPENVVNIIKLIETSNIDNKPYYIDMESGIRDNNVFSVEKCRDIIDNILK